MTATPARPPAPPLPRAVREARPGWAAAAGVLGVVVAATGLGVAPLAMAYAGGAVFRLLQPFNPWWVVLPEAVAAAVVAGSVPVLQMIGAIRLLDRRGRRMLVCSGLPFTVFWVVTALGPILGLDPAPLPVLVLLLPPAVPPVLALLPSVTRWLATAPRAVEWHG